MAMHPVRNQEGIRDGRDELNLADFPISVLQRQQPTDAQGVKVDMVTYEASRFDRQSRQRVQQKVVLETSSRHGLPTPADENLVLALLYVAKHAHNFTSPVVHFIPRQLFEIMGWSPNSRSYDRLRAVLRRLKALVIRYENSWWDITGRAYEAEVATGIISEYELGRQVSGRKKQGATPACWVRWTPHFQASLANGNLKKLDLERLFALKLPTAQRMYRFLDKRFYPPHQPPDVEMDLHDFACGHIGLSQVENVAELKRRLTPAIKELEGIGFISRLAAAERFRKVRKGVWRVRFQAGPDFLSRVRERPQNKTGTEEGPLPEVMVLNPATPGGRDAETQETETELARLFYRQWMPLGDTSSLSEGDIQQARNVLEKLGSEDARPVVVELVRILTKHWPACRSFSGAVQKYLDHAVKVHAQRRKLKETRAAMKQEAERQRSERKQHTVQEREREAAWEALPEEERRELMEQVLKEHPHLRSHPTMLKMLCLSRLSLVPVYDSE